MAGASTLEKLAVAREHGADALVDYATEPLTDRVMALTDGRSPTCASSGRRRGYKLVRLYRGSEKPSIRAQRDLRSMRRRRIIEPAIEARAKPRAVTYDSRLGFDDPLDAAALNEVWPTRHARG